MALDNDFDVIHLMGLYERLQILLVFKKFLIFCWRVVDLQCYFQVYSKAIHLYIYIYMYIFPFLFHYGSLQEIIYF